MFYLSVSFWTCCSRRRRSSVLTCAYVCFVTAVLLSASRGPRLPPPSTSSWGRTLNSAMWVVVKNTLPIPSFPSSCQSQIVHSSLFVCAGVNIHLEKKKSAYMPLSLSTCQICVNLSLLLMRKTLEPCQFILPSAALFGNTYAVFDSSVMGNSSY